MVFNILDLEIDFISVFRQAILYTFSRIQKYSFVHFTVVIASDEINFGVMAGNLQHICSKGLDICSSGQKELLISGLQKKLWRVLLFVFPGREANFLSEHACKIGGVAKTYVISNFGNGQIGTHEQLFGFLVSDSPYELRS